MITETGCLARRQRLWDQLQGSCDAVLLASPEAIAYFTGFAPGPFSFRMNEAYPMAILRPGHAMLVGDNLLEPFLREAFADEVVAPVWYEARRSAGPRRPFEIGSVIRTLGNQLPERLGIDSCVPELLIGRMRLARPSLRLTPIDGILWGLRRTKDPDEIETLKTAIQAGEAGMVAGRQAAQTGATELDVFHAVEHAARKSVGRPVTIYGDFATGKRATDPDTRPTRHPLMQGDLFILDFSVIVAGYRGDIASTFSVGEPTAQQAEVFQACLHALEVGESMLRPGTECRSIDQAIRAAYAEHQFRSDAPGHAGHGLGLGHPEAPYIVSESDETLQAGDVITLEPSLFPAGLEGGVRIERNYLITESGFETLSRHALALKM